MPEPKNQHDVVDEVREQLKPFKIETMLLIAAPDSDAAAERWEQLDDALEALGFIGEGGTLGAMDPDLVIPGSPLDKALTEPFVSPPSDRDQAQEQEAQRVGERHRIRITFDDTRLGPMLRLLHPATGCDPGEGAPGTCWLDGWLENVDEPDGLLRGEVVVDVDRTELDGDQPVFHFTAQPEQHCGGSGEILEGFVEAARMVKGSIGPRASRIAFDALDTALDRYEAARLAAPTQHPDSIVFMVGDRVRTIGGTTLPLRDKFAKVIHRRQREVGTPWVYRIRIEDDEETEFGGLLGCHLESASPQPEVADAGEEWPEEMRLARGVPGNRPYITDDDLKPLPEWLEAETYVPKSRLEQAERQVDKWAARYRDANAAADRLRDNFLAAEARANTLESQLSEVREKGYALQRWTPSDVEGGLEPDSLGSVVKTADLFDLLTTIPDKEAPDA